MGVCVPVCFRYYSIDAVVVREILGKKLASRTRKDLDDISELTTVPLRSCRRQVLCVLHVVCLFVLSCSKQKQ